MSLVLAASECASQEHLDRGLGWGFEEKAVVDCVAHKGDAGLGVRFLHEAALHKWCVLDGGEPERAKRLSGRRANCRV